jgi:retron-type reverse transcriptase
MLIVGGLWSDGSNAGVRNANANNSPGNANNNIGFRSANCAPVAARDLRIAAIVRAHHTCILRFREGAEYKTHRRQRVATRNLKPDSLMPHTYKYLFDQICEFSNLHAAYHRAAKGKRNRPDVISFTGNLGENLIALRDQLQSMEWQPGTYRKKVIHEPKERIIRIAPFSDRIVHQSLCSVIAPLFENTFIHDTYACRVGKGTHKAIDRLTQFLRRPGSNYILKLDLRKFFDSIPHGLVMRELEWRIADSRTLELCRRILTSYQADPSIFPAGFGPRGLPIGNLTSQWFANIVGSRIDYHVKHVLRCRYYARYMDDLVLLGSKQNVVKGWEDNLRSFIEEMGLVTNPKTCVFPTRIGVPFLGHKVWCGHRRILRPNVVAGRRRMRGLMAAVEREELPGGKAIESLRSWFQHLSHADSYRLRVALWREAKPILGGFLC